MLSDLSKLLTSPKLFTRHCFLLITLILISGCTMRDYKNNVEIAALTSPSQALSRLSYQTSQYHARNSQENTKDNSALTTLQSSFKKQVISHWGNEQALFSTHYRYVKYANDYRSRSIIDFDLGFVRVESLNQDNNRQFLQQAIEYALLAPESPAFTDFYTSYTSEVLSTPFLYQQIKDQDGKLIKWHWRATRFAKHLIDESYTEIQQGANILAAVSFSLLPNHTKIREQRYLPLIKQQAKRHGVDDKLVRAIIQQESLFNPYALNPDNRIGLMQVSSATMGKDVFKQQKQWPFTPSQNYLFDNSNNLDIGISYLSLLDKHYLKGINNSKSRYYATIASYIAGPSNMLQTFSKDKKEALIIINNLSSYEVYQSLTTKQSKPEIKSYVIEVNNNFRQLSK